MYMFVWLALLHGVFFIFKKSNHNGWFYVMRIIFSTTNKLIHPTEQHFCKLYNAWPHLCDILKEAELQ